MELSQLFSSDKIIIFADGDPCTSSWERNSE